MNERLTIQDLIDLLAAKHSMTKKDAEVFVKEFFLLIEQALENEKTVKIKGLGTFKLIDVDSRESVNVNTGERFQIKGHTKVSFSPDANLRDTINKPFAHFETVVLNENTVLEDTPVEEVEEEEVGEEILASTIEDYNKKEESQENTSNPIVENESQIAEQDSSEEVDTVQEERITEQSIEEKVVVEESLMVEQQQPEQPVKEKERITAEQIEVEGKDDGTFRFGLEKEPSQYKVISRCWLNAQNRTCLWSKEDIEPGEFYHYDMKMVPTDHTLKRGHKLALILYGIDAQQTQRPDTVTEITFIADSIDVRVPVIR